MKYISVCILVLAMLSSSVYSFDIGSFLPKKGRKKAEKLSEDMNNFIKGANNLAGEEVIKPLENREGLGRMFFTVTPTPSVSPTPSTTPSPSITPTPSVSPSISTTPSSIPSATTTPTASRTPTPSPSKKASSNNSNNNSNTTPTTPTTQTFTESESAQVSSDGTALDVAVDFSSETAVTDGDEAEITTILASGDIPVTTTTRSLIFGSVRQTSANAYLIITFPDGSSIDVPVTNSCADGLGEVSFPASSSSVSSGAVSFTVVAVGFGDGCPINLEVTVAVVVDTSSATPEPAPSN